MSQQYPFGSANDRYKKKLFVDTGQEFVEVRARIVEPYSAPAPSVRNKELQIINAPSEFHGQGISSYKCTLTLLFMDKEAYSDYLLFSGWTHKFYDEKGAIFLGAVESIKPTPKEASKKYMVEVSLILIKKDAYDKKDRFQFQDIESHWAKNDIEEMANIGLLSVITSDGQPVLYFRPDAYITRAEFIVFLNRSRRFLERVIRE